MDDKFRSILKIALHPNTGDGEAAAALNRARALAEKRGLDNLLADSASNTTVNERVVYRTKPTYTNTTVYTCKISPNWQLTFIERMFKDAAAFDCEVEMISCGPRPDGFKGMELKVRVLGTETSIANFDGEIERWYEVMNAGIPPHESTSNNTSKSSASSVSWWEKIKKFI